MANTKISAFAAGAPAQSTDLIVVARSGSNFSLLGSDLVTLAGATLAPKASPTFTGTVTLPSGQALIAPALGTPASGILTNCTFPTLNQNTTGTAAGLSGTPNISVGAITATSYVNPIPTANLPNGLNNHNTSQQAMTIAVAGTFIYVAGSQLTMPATYKAGIQAGTTFVWEVTCTKNAAGTGAMSIEVLQGSTGAIGDSQFFTQAFPASTAVVDSLFLTITFTWTSTTAGYWSISAQHAAVTATGFGLATGTQYSGTVTGKTSTTGSTIYGVAFTCATGGTLPTYTIQRVAAYAYNVT